MKNTLYSDGLSNLEWLVSLLKQRLQSNSKAKPKDDSNHVMYVNTDIFATETLEAFIYLSISEFNQTPYFTSFSLEDSSFVKNFAEILVEGATLYALSSQALVEKGREYTTSDNGMFFNPPNVSEMLNTQYCTLLTHHWDKLKTIKSSSLILKIKE